MLLLTLIGLLATQSGMPATASSVKISDPLPIVEIDTGKLKGQPVRLSWSPDERQLYIQLVERQRTLTSVTHALVTLSDRSIKKVDSEPGWSVKYWAWKSAQAAPGAPSVRITVDSRQELVRSTAAPRGGDLARGDPGGGVAGTSTEDAVSAGNQTQMATKYTLRLKGEVLGEWVNEPVIPGLTFGWAPASVGLIAFRSLAERLVLMDLAGEKQEVAGAKDVLLPCWSDAGSKIAYLERGGRKKFSVMVTDVKR